MPQVSTTDSPSKRSRAQELQHYWDKHASSYDREMAFMERWLFAGGREWVCRQAVGDVLEVAIGTGRNLVTDPGFGLTLGIHSRIEATIAYIRSRMPVGNIYVNRNMIGATVGVQPFGGEGLSGTGPKAGGPHYVARFAIERVTCIDTTAAGGNASLMASIEG